MLHQVVIPLKIAEFQWNNHLVHFSGKSFLPVSLFQWVAPQHFNDRSWHFRPDAIVSSSILVYFHYSIIDNIVNNQWYPVGEAMHSSERATGRSPSGRCFQLHCHRISEILQRDNSLSCSALTNELHSYTLNSMVFQALSRYISVATH